MRSSSDRGCRGGSRRRGSTTSCRAGTACRSSKPRRPRKTWHCSPLPATVCDMQTIVMILVAFVREFVLSRATLRLENIALRQQVAVLNRERPRPRLHPLDRVFWVLLSRLWPCWKDALVIVKPETVVGWHRQGFRLFWKWKSCHGKPGRPRTSIEIRELIQRMSRENPLWGAPRIHGELLKLGIDVSQATVTRYMVRHPQPAVADLADVPQQPCGLSRFDRFLCRPTLGPFGRTDPKPD